MQRGKANRSPVTSADGSEIAARLAVWSKSQLPAPTHAVLGEGVGSHSEDPANHHRPDLLSLVLQLGGADPKKPTGCLPRSAELSLFLFREPSLEVEGIGYRNLGKGTASPQEINRVVPNSSSAWRG